MARADLVRMFVARRKKPPRKYQALGPNPNRAQYKIPGIGEYGRQQNQREYARQHPEMFPDGPYRPKRRRRRGGPTRPTPGSTKANRPRVSYD